MGQMDMTKFCPIHARKLRSQHVAAGVGSMPARGYEENCVRMPDYGWDHHGFEIFTHRSAGQGLLEIDVWTCDINNYGKTRPWLFEKLSEFLAGGPYLSREPQCRRMFHGGNLEIG